MVVDGAGGPSTICCYLHTLTLAFGGIIVPEITVIPILGSPSKLEQALSVLRLLIPFIAPLLFALVNQ